VLTAKTTATYSNRLKQSNSRNYSQSPLSPTAMHRSTQSSPYRQRKHKLAPLSASSVAALQLWDGCSSPFNWPWAGSECKHNSAVWGLSHILPLRSWQWGCYRM